MIVKLLTEHYLEFLSLKGGCRGSSQSTYVKMPHCWKSHATVHYVQQCFQNRTVYKIKKKIKKIMLFVILLKCPIIIGIKMFETQFALKMFISNKNTFSHDVTHFIFKVPRNCIFRELEQRQSKQANSEDLCPPPLYVCL